MRVAFIVGRFPNLSETFILSQITGLLDRGHDVDIYADPSDDARAHEEVERYGLLARTHYSLRMPRNRLIRLVKAFALLMAYVWKDPQKVLRALNRARYGREASSLRLLFAVIPFAGRPTARYDVLHCHFGAFGVRGMFLRDVGALSGKLITTFHGGDLTQTVRKHGERIYDRLLANGDLFLPISELWQRRLVALGGPADRIRVHRMGIPCGRFAFRPRSRPQAEPVRFLSVCRLVEKKGIEYGIRAMAMLVVSGRSVRYDIVGDGPLRAHLKDLIVALGAADFVALHGWRTQSEVLAMLDSAHVFLAPSVQARNGDREGIPVALMEAMAIGLPVISTRHSAIPELIEDERSGLLANERDADALYKRATYLLDHANLWAGLSAAGRARVEQHYDVESLNDRLVELFQGLLRDVGPLRQRQVRARPMASTSMGR